MKNGIKITPDAPKKLKWTHPKDNDNDWQVQWSKNVLDIQMCFRPEECRHMLTQFGQREITPESVAKVLGMMARTPSALPDQPPGQVC